MLSSATDPYYVAKDEVQAAIKKVQTMHDEWKRLLQSENTAKSTRFQELHSEIAAELRSLDYDLQDITETIKVVEENRTKFQFDNSEIQSRKDFVQASRANVKALQDSVASRQAVGKIESDRRQALGTSSSNPARDDRQNAAARENEAFMDRQRQEQAQLIAQQDQDLALFSQSAQRLRETAQAINVELQDQQKMLEELDEDIDKETEKLNFVMKRIGRLLKTSDNKQLCLIVGLCVLLLVLVFLVINT
mmetsp:Transcript_10190/g.30612  ORF Transcript_10190/g.30612 Transcript_10190/m.30612 type:complete len:249 (-) Transcript_10190:40-786(-)|eukprot:CAMPEP_0175284308 /NCGR_PEP_ID=MMETSP0093-20121207/52608_1 /TAXON_ID=311494 /ORGANISM="Alexandrium monilatum, Strain CCMP3105" /LENGTH=248 /DNA_ID=CAMNT_0016579593 /DNA_START=34 /DNA_END=780 /DNA_ORIENTATION=-